MLCPGEVSLSFCWLVDKIGNLESFSDEKLKGKFQSIREGFKETSENSGKTLKAEGLSPQDLKVLLLKRNSVILMIIWWKYSPSLRMRPAACVVLNILS